MNVDQILEILRTRVIAAAQDGNPTERSFLFELVKITEDYKKLKEQTENKR